MYWITIISNLALTYIAALMFSVTVSSFFTHPGTNNSRKFITIMFNTVILTLLYMWGSTLEINYYGWIFVGIIVLNLINQFRYIVKKIRYSQERNF